MAPQQQPLIRARVRDAFIQGWYGKVAAVSVLILFASLKFWASSPGPAGKQDNKSEVSSTLQLNVTNQELPLLSDLLSKSGSDKFSSHRYDHYYARWLDPYRRLTELALLEIGVLRAESLSFWREYFLYPKLILGLAYGDDSRGGEAKANTIDKVKVIRGDQSKVETMDIIKNMGPFHIIVDDGSHFPCHVIFTLFHLWPSVQPGGIYIVEDLETSYWSSGRDIYGYRLIGTGFGATANASAVEKVKQLIDVLARNHVGAGDRLSIMPGDNELCSIEFGKNLVALRKCSKHEMKNSPPMREKRYDEPSFQNWLDNAKASNPEGF